MLINIFLNWGFQIRKKCGIQDRGQKGEMVLQADRKNYERGIAWQQKTEYTESECLIWSCCGWSGCGIRKCRRRIKIVTLQSVPIACLKMTAKESLQSPLSALLHSSFLPRVSAQKAPCALFGAAEMQLQAEVFSADLRQGNLRVEKPVFNTCAVFAEHSDLPFLYSPSGECKHRIWPVIGKAAAVPNAVLRAEARTHFYERKVILSYT